MYKLKTLGFSVFTLFILTFFNGVKAEEYVANHLERDFFEFGERCGDNY